MVQHLLAASLAAEKLVELPAITSIETSLGARKVSEHAFQICRKRPVESVVVDDQSAVEACLRFWDDHRTVVEPACGAALAVGYTHPDRLASYEQVLIIVCGGATTSVNKLMQFGWSQSRKT